MRHAMYDKTANSSNLRQGDILVAEKVQPILRNHLDYFATKSHFVAFCVLTQTCDLRKDHRVHFITLAVVREITDAFSRHEREKPGVTGDLLRKIINHNWNKRAYFYLHNDEGTSLNEPCVADLRVCVSVSIRDDERYDALLKARCISLSDGYAAALGVMAGQVYGRVATEDWDDNEIQPKSSKAYTTLLGETIKKKKLERSDAQE